MNNQELKDKILKLFEMAKKLEEKNVDTSHFNPPVSKEEIKKWEIANNLVLPDSYKQILEVANGCIIMGTRATFFGLKEIEKVIRSKDFFKEDLIRIGDIIGDGEFLLFSKESGKIISFFEGEYKELGDMSSTIDMLIGLVKSDYETYCEDKPKMSPDGIMLKILKKKEKEGRVLSDGEMEILKKLRDELGE